MTKITEALQATENKATFAPQPQQAIKQNVLGTLEKEEYQELQVLKGQENLLKSQAFDLQEQINKVKAQITEAETRLDAMRSDVAISGQNFVRRYKEILSRFTTDETLPLRVTDEEPHQVIAFEIPKAV